MNDEEWKTLNAVSRLHTITFRYPRTFLKAVAASLGRIGDYASTMEAETFIREAVKANIESLMAEHLGRKSVLKARIRQIPTPITPHQDSHLRKKLFIRRRRT